MRGGARQRRQAGKQEDESARDLAQEVTDILGGKSADAVGNEGAQTEAERLVAIFGFIIAQCAEAIHAPHPQKSEQVRIAMATYSMMMDIVTLRHHPVHKFFRGVASQMNRKTTPSRDLVRNDRFAACVVALERLGRSDGYRKADARRAILNHPSLKDLVTTEEQLKAWTYKAETERAEQLELHVGLLLPLRDRDAILQLTADLVGFYESPLDLAVAVTSYDRGYAFPDGKGGHVLGLPAGYDPIEGAEGDGVGAMARLHDPES